MLDQPLLITVDAEEASDSWGFVGLVRVGAVVAYRTIRAYRTPLDARTAAQELVAHVLGALLAGQEWRGATDEFGHAPRRSELELGLGLRAGDRHRPAGAGLDESQDLT